jgi:DNA repair exonuclease SbcCD ATPase subunit
MTSSTTPLTVENITKLKAQVEGRTDELRCRRDEAAHKLVAELIRGGRFNESALERITAMSTTVESLKLLAPVFDGAIIRVKTEAIDQQLAEVRERLASAAGEVDEAQRALRAAERAEPSLDAGGKIDFGDGPWRSARAAAARAGNRFDELQREIVALEQKRASVNAQPDEPVAEDADGAPVDDASSWHGGGTRRPGTPMYAAG